MSAELNLPDVPVMAVGREDCCGEVSGRSFWLPVLLSRDF